MKSSSRTYSVRLLSLFSLNASNALVLCPFMKEFVIEAIRSIAELIIWGDQNDDSTFFE